ncbi:hypothetical protein U2100_15250, partial [Listeria monocytogenes]|uniref:hypothetical protein n=1 Tax=Listeria monocytogenes TaxID=1639 RepID=UPI002FDC3251
YIDGFITKASADANVYKIPAPAALTNSNVVSAAFDPCYQALPDALKFDTGVTFFVSYATYSLYEEYQRNQTYKGIDVTSMGVPAYRGHEVV